MDINEGTTTEDLWTPYKELLAVVEGYLATKTGQASYSIHSFESVLRRHKQTFLSLLKYPPKNASSRDEIKRGITEGVNVPNMGRVLLSKELVDEAIIISDMYNVNEYLSLALLHSATKQMPRHPGLARGLLAVILYYDGRRAIVQALKHTLTARDGVLWCTNAREEIISYVTRYVDQLISDGLLENVLEALKRTELGPEIELLQNNRALPPAPHHNKLLTTMEDIRKLLAEVIFVASAQRGLHRDFLMRLLSEIIKSPLQGGGAATGALDEVPLALQMALLYALDLSVLHRREDGEDLARKLPLLQDPELISVLVDELSPTQEPTTDLNVDKNSAGVRALCQLALGLALAALKRAPQSVLRRSGYETKTDLLDQDEVLVDAAIDGRVFEYLNEVVLSSNLVVEEEYYQRRLHSLITDFIVLMHSKLMEMRARANEAGRSAEMYMSEGVTMSVVGPLHALLACVEKLYRLDPLRLRHDYWLADTDTRSSSSRAASLYKFVRLSGELVHPGVVAAYLRALAAIAIHKHTWALLQGHHPLSATHLLAALHRYHCNLRQDPNPLSEQVHATSLGGTSMITPGIRPGRLLVREEEVDAMISALKLIAAVAREDPAACAAICENLQWDAVNCMFGLICCHVPLSLKAQLCETLAAFAGTASGRLWEALEAAQLVGPNRRALSMDLLEVECRLEQYPLSLAFVRLLQALSTGPLPRTLGAGHRTPGLDPYVQHVLHKLALPAPHRAYADPNQKHQMMCACLELFVSWLDAYSPTSADFCTTDMNPPPGYHILLQLHTQGELLRTVLDTLHDTSHPLEKRCVVHALRLLELALQQERALVREAAEVNKATHIIGLSKLILGVDRRAGPEPLVLVCAWVEAGGELCARASAVLRHVLGHAAAAPHLLAAAHSANIRHYFVECLEADENDDSKFVRQAKINVIQIMQQLLHTPAPNFTHYLLGYSLTDNVANSALNEPGVNGTPRTCLHSILEILDQHIAGPENNEREASELVEGGYRLLYHLCARPNTSAPLLRLLRARDNFLCRHLRPTVNLATAKPVTISSRSWVLRACACEAGSAVTHHAPLATLLATLTGVRQGAELEWCLIRRLLEGARMSLEPTPEPRWELFHAPQLRAAIDSCDINTGVGGKRISVARVNALLSRELAALQPSAPQRQRVAAEIQKVLDYVTEVNHQRNTAATLTHYYDSWRQLTEIIFCVAPPEVLPLETKKNLILSILQDLLTKISPDEVLPQLGNLATGTVLLLLVNLRHCYVMQKRESKLDNSEFESTFFGLQNHLMQTKSLSLKFVLQKILSWILVSSGSTQKMRVNLYGALLNFLSIVNLKTGTVDLEEKNFHYVSRLDKSVSRVSKDESCLKGVVIEVLSSFGDGLCRTVCNDITGGGHEVCRMVALACMDSLLEVHPQTEWMDTLTDHGYLASLIDSILQDDEELKLILEPKPKSLRVLYVYTSKMALLIKMAGTTAGAVKIMAAGTLSALATLSVLSCHPDVHAHRHDNHDTRHARHDTDFLPSPSARYREILIPALSLCNALVTSLGSDNHSALTHIMYFLLAHMDSIDVVLRAAHPGSPSGVLREVEALTWVVSAACGGGAVTPGPACPAGPTALRVHRLRDLMLALLPRFRVPSTSNHDHDKLYYKIVVNLLRFAYKISECGPPRALFAKDDIPKDTSISYSMPSCEVLADILQVMVRCWHDESRSLATLTHQLHSLHTLTVEEVRRMVEESVGVGVGGSECRAVAARTVGRLAAGCGAALTLCALAAQLAAHLLWTNMRGQVNSAQKSTKETTVDHRALAAIFNDRFTDQLLDITKSEPATQRGFLEVMLKEIKIFLQYSPTAV